MRLHLKASLLALALCSVASPALAHGIELLVPTFATVGAVAGLIGGVATAALRFRVAVGLGAMIGIGLGATIGTVMIGGVLLALAGPQDPSFPLGERIQAVLALLLFFGTLPLVVVFFIAFAVVSLVRAGVESKRKRR